MLPWNLYGDFLRDNFAWLASTTVYIAVVLMVMQVGLATSLATNEAFQAASYGFTVFSILGPLVVMCLILATFLCIFVWNWVATVAFGKGRLTQIPASWNVMPKINPSGGAVKIHNVQISPDLGVLDPVPQ
ncbi:uncharacterized protein PG986_015185 [Apiospora aurea]